ncbi:MAG: GNAT family N-acetyltransferase [Paenibacillus sp.]|uniref:GNAT family N-acetyltransferase n=1 Tax=Paenibacillus sp. TaxID=58172 RepID=UPI0025D445C7|nr:GNAT family N-acetyltransferase [Paenibacillus sp.]MBR2566941.1 GNAT family N-acetyltransferase [Paenibacillus sp.]
MIIREAEINDAEAIERLYRELLPNNTKIKVVEDRIEEIKHDHNSYLFVCEVDQEIVATAHLHLCLDALIESQPFGVVERVIVSGNRQGQGYGSLIMKHIEDLCISRNCVKIFLASGASRKQAHKFYTNLGYDGDSSKAFKKYL